MKIRPVIILFFCILFVWGLTAERDRVEALEIGLHNSEQMPKGKEADGLPNDFILRNNKIHALVSGAQPFRRANMTTEYAFVLQGCLFDLDLRGEDNDQLTAFRPGGEGGYMSFVKIADDGSGSGTAVIEAVRTAAKGDGLYTRHEYRLEQDWQYLLVSSTYRNESQEVKTITPSPVWKGLDGEQTVGNIRVGDSIDPFDKRGYASGPVKGTTLIDEMALEPGEEKTFQVRIAVADSPLAAYGVLAAAEGPTGEVSGIAKDSAGQPAVHASLLVDIDGTRIPHYPDAEGRFSFRLPTGDHKVKFEDIGRDPLEKQVSVKRNSAAQLDFAVSKASTVKVAIKDAGGRPSPGKVQFIGIDGTTTPNFGTDYRAHGGNHQYQTHDGRVTQQVPPGKYLLRVTLGPEHDIVEKRIEVAREQTLAVEATLQRSVDTKGWISTDYHAHSTPSGDNYCNTYDRVINLAAEHIEFAPTTEHQRLYDWEPYIDRLGLSSRIKTVPGIELTGSGQHFNAFPFVPDPLSQNGGAPLWTYDPRINAIVLRNWGTPSLAAGSRIDALANARNRVEPFGGGPDRWVQANHPNVGNVFFDRDQDGDRDGGFVGFEELIDGAEVWSDEILNLSPSYAGRRGANRTFGWLQMLNQGRHVWCVAVSDAHRVFGNGVGGWRTYVPSSTDQPGDIDHAEIIRNSKAGRMMITNGPFLKVTTAEGLPIGSTVVSAGFIDLNIQVQTPNWLEIDRVQVLVSGRQPEQYNFRKDVNPGMFSDGTVKFDEIIRVMLQRDEHLIVVATGENSNLEKGWGLNPYGQMHPVAYTNPIYVDVDHNGFQANGDTLGYPLMTAPRAD
ncbi:MAG: carboxypeptidase regulatory-like domain-containing protein [Bryobacterales bacterium]|nr:carboxypeptidase regulatory-like domain-containing protein [Bryobacterales bacterium]